MSLQGIYALGFLVTLVAVFFLGLKYPSGRYAPWHKTDRDPAVGEAFSAAFLWPVLVISLLWILLKHSNDKLR